MALKSDGEGGHDDDDDEGDRVHAANVPAVGESEERLSGHVTIEVAFEVAEEISLLSKGSDDGSAESRRGDVLKQRRFRLVFEFSRQNYSSEN